MAYISKIFKAVEDVSVERLNAMNMNPVVHHSGFPGFIDHPAGQQPYRIMKHLYDALVDAKDGARVKATLLGVGRDGGLATLSSCKDIMIDVYDIYSGNNNPHKCLDEEPKALLSLPNVTYYPNGADFDRIAKSDLIIFDMHPHDGIGEQAFLRELERRSYEGIVIMTCIKLTEGIKDVWNNINIKKIDISNKAHWAGTGIVFFEKTRDMERELDEQSRMLQEYKKRAVKAEMLVQELIAQNEAYKECTELFVKELTDKNEYYKNIAAAAEARVNELEMIVFSMADDEEVSPPASPSSHTEKNLDEPLIDFTYDDAVISDMTTDPFVETQAICAPSIAGAAAIKRYENFQRSAYGRRVIRQLKEMK